MKLCFIGGEDVKRRTMKKIYKKLMHGRILVLEWTTENEEKIAKYKKVLSDYLSEFGNVKILDLKTNSKEVKEEIKKANVIYIPGGLPEIFMKYARKFKLKSALSNFNGTIIGNSAGALVLPKKVIITKDEDHPKTKLLNGLGLVNFSIEVHYHNNDDELRQIRVTPIYAITENSAMIYDTETKEFEFYGKVCVINKN